MPYATNASAAISGASLALLFKIGELSGGPLRILLGVVGTAWFLVSIIMFVSGRRPLEYNNKWLAGKRPYWDSRKEAIPRCFVWFGSVALTIWAFNILLK